MFLIKRFTKYNFKTFINENKEKLKNDDFTFSYLLSKILENSTSEETMKY